LKKIYVDITQLYAWQGKLTGIQRVMDEISKRFLDDKRFSPIFIVWNKNKASFFEVDFKNFLLEREKLQTSSTLIAKKNQTRARRIARAKRLLRRVYHKVPLSRTTYNLYTSLNSKVIELTSPHKIITLDDNSMLFMPHGGVWESDTYITKILELKKDKKIKLITVLYDLCPVLSPQFVVEAVSAAYENYMKQVLPKSDLVLAISENTARDARHWLQSIGQEIPPNIKVFRLGDEAGSNDQKAVKVPQKYILCVGTIEARKNHAGLYYAYKLAAEKGEDLPPIVLVGRLGWMAGDVYQLITTDPSTKNKFKFLHNTSDNELAWLYEHALFSIYPSFYEGWGLPIAESLLRGTPCLASETTSMPEIAGKLVEYFSPYSPEQIKTKIELYANNPKELRAKRDQIKKEYKTTSWDATYRQVTKLIDA
jgi:glycosyltransferase involved in cell wall biosynthesis